MDFSGDSEEESRDYYLDDGDTMADAVADSIEDAVADSIEKDNYTVLKEADIRQRMEDDITEVSDVLSIPKPEASILLRHYNWSVGKVNDAWFADEYGVRQKIGLFDKPVIQLPFKVTTNLTCGICFESYLCNRFCWVACGHAFCSDCFASYINTSINDGLGCLMLRCPQPSCNAAIGQDMINKMASDENKDKYCRYLVGSYIEDNKKTKWCPAPGCDYVVDFDVGGGGSNVSCLCSHKFCWNCNEEAHRPVDCDTVAKWILKNESDAENTNWILVHTKPCPKCKRPIEKNQGCMHMTCTPPCNFHFCWVCLQDWTVHGYGGACNQYKEGHSEGNTAKKLAAKHLERYTHYYERWAGNEVSTKKAFADLQQVQSMQIEKLSNSQCQPDAQLKFITEAWQQIVECRRVLKWTYAYGYYLAEDELAKKQLFEYSQGDAESALERLHHCAEKEVEVFLNADSPLENFNEFRTKLAGLTTVTKTFFENLVNALENGLSDVASSSKRCKKGSKEHAVSSATAQGTCSNVVLSTTPQDSSTNVVDYTAQGPWTCDYCTYVNGSSALACRMCNRGPWSCNLCTYANPRNATTCQVCEEPQ